MPAKHHHACSIVGIQQLDPAQEDQTRPQGSEPWALRANTPFRKKRFKSTFCSISCFIYYLLKCTLHFYYVHSTEQTCIAAVDKCGLEEGGSEWERDTEVKMQNEVRRRKPHGENWELLKGSFFLVWPSCLIHLPVWSLFWAVGSASTMAARLWLTTGYCPLTQFADGGKERERERPRREPK